MKMNQIAIVIAMSLVSATAFADVTTANSGAVAGATNAGNAQSISQTYEASVIPDNVKIRNVPDAVGPALASSNDTCMGSTSGGIAAAGFGISLGSTWTDGNCKMLKNSRELWNMGMKAAAMARMCMDSENKEALELTGFTCPTKKEDK